MLHHRAGVVYANQLRQGASVEAGFPLPRKDVLGCAAQELFGMIDLTMSENNGVDPFTATHAPPIERPNFEHFLPDHQPAAAMAAVGLALLFADE